MPATIVATREAADPTRRADLEKLFASPAFLFLKEMVAARCALHQTEAMNAALYQDNPEAAAKAESERNKASDCNKVLDMLDDLSRKEDEWFTVKLELSNP